MLFRSGPIRAAPAGIAIDEAGSLWVSDAGNHTLRRISAAGVVSTAAGTPGQCGMAQGGPGVGQLCNPGSLVSDRAGGLLVADGSATIRRVASDGTLSAFVGVYGSPGFSDGLVARFTPPLQLATDKAGNLYVADSGNSLVRKVTPAGVTSTVTGTFVQRGFLKVITSPATPGTITVDGVAVPQAQFKVVGNSNWEVARILSTDGVHKLKGTEPFGVLVVGYDAYDSYGYPGGLNQLAINPQQ